MPTLLCRSLLSAGILALGLSLTGCATSDSAKSATPAPPAPEPKAASAKEQSLYERLGGANAIVAVVDDFTANVAADKRINRFFAKTDIPNFKAKLVEQICAATGGPCTYTGKDMKTAHAGMGVTKAHFNALVEDLIKTLNKFKVPAKEQQELLALLGPMEKDIVTRG